MNGRAGLFTGAGLSHGAPAGLPLGRGFHRLLFEASCADAARIAPDVVDRATLDSLSAGHWNLLARIESTLPGAGVGALAAMKVTIPNEEHLLAAIHLAEGGYHLTVNFDDGVETAYGLLSGVTQLPAEVPGVFHDALARWKGCFPNPAPPLSVISHPDEFAAASFRARPMMVKLHGSLGAHPDGIVLSRPRMADEPDVYDIGRHRIAAYDELGRHPEIVVTGFSGTDPASSTPVFARLRPGAFQWVALDVATAVRSTLESIDGNQPVIGRAAEAIRQLLRRSPPPWPATPWRGPSYEDRVRLWLDGLPPGVLAEAFAWTLADAGLHQAAIPILERLVAEVGSRPRTRIRLADALLKRSEQGDARAARTTFEAAALRRDGDLRGYALRRWAECIALESADGPVRSRRLPRLAQTQAVLAAIRVAYRDGPVARAHATTVLVGVMLRGIEASIPDSLASRVQRAALAAEADLALPLVARAIAQSAGAPSGRRRALLRRQRVELRAIVALLRGRPVSVTMLAASSHLIRTFDYLSDRRGLADAFATQALVWLALGDVDRAGSAYDRARGIGAGAGVVTLAGELLTSRQRLTRS